MSGPERLRTVIQARRARGEAVFMPFLVLGDPDPETSLDLARALVRAGADILEFGFPFSDPPADGPVIQAADTRALAAGTTPELCFELLARLRTETDRPFTLLMYWNLILQFGVDAFYRRAAEVGVDAVLVADLPLEEAEPAVVAARAQGVAPICIVSELSTDARLAALAPLADGYLYVVTALGITGTRASLGAALAPTLARARAASPLPLLAGFGISTPEHVAEVRAAGADGAIVGSALIRALEARLGNPAAAVAAVETAARALAEAAHRPASG